MRDFFKSWKFKIFLIVAALLIGIILRASATGGLTTFAQNAVSTLMSPFQKAASYVTDGFSGFLSNIVNLGSLKGENEQLKKEVNSLQDKMVDYNEIKRQNEQLKDIVGLPDEGDKRKYLPAKVISRDPGQWFSAFTIDKGTLDGVAKNQPVITNEGLVGVVTSVNLNSAVISTILDPTVHVGSIVSRTSDTGITQGQSKNCADGEFELAYLTKNSSVTEGDIVITNGRGGVFPKNIKVGLVQKLNIDVSGNSVNAICKPMVDPTTVKNVTVITDFSGKDTQSNIKKSTTTSSSSSTAGGSKK